MNDYQSWGMPRSKNTKQRFTQPSWRDFNIENLVPPLLGYGNGRSYGDSCQNHQGTIIDNRHLDKFIEFDTEQGILECETGVLFQDILNLIIPKGWMIPVTPGTRFVTLGGAIANDVHGKNHHVDGCFGNHVLNFELLRSDGGRIECSPVKNGELFGATIGGLGLTGFVTRAKFKLKRIKSHVMEVQSIPFQGFDEFLELSSLYARSHHYGVGWLDCISKGNSFGRGVFLAANHSDGSPGGGSFTELRDPKLGVPFNLPGICLNSLSMSLFNKLMYVSLSGGSAAVKKQSLTNYFYPLDAVGNWNRIYGKSGFFQYQFVIPHENLSQLEEALAEITQSKLASFLVVVKEFGSLDSPGFMSFPQPGICLALDFRNVKHRTASLLDRLDEIILRAGGRLYPAKDRRMSELVFKEGYPQWSKFREYIDPKFTSDFWARVSGVRA